MDRDLNNFVPQNGMEVIGSDGEKIGEIDAVEQDYFVVRKGFFFPQDHYIPLTAVSSYDDGKVYLNVTKDGALEQDWSQPPVSTGAAYTETMTTEYVEEPVVERGVEYVEDRDVRPDGDQTIELAAEDLQATKRKVERGAVQIEKDVVTQHKSIDVPVTEEEVNITRRSVDRDVDGSHAFEEGTIEVPLRGEEVELTKTARVVEEIDIDKTAREHIETVSGEVRREEVHIDGQNVDVDRNRDFVDGDDRGLVDHAKDAMDRDNDGKIGR